MATCNTLVGPAELITSEDEGRLVAILNLRGCTGFDLEPYARLQAEDDSWPLKSSIQVSTAKNNVDMAPSLAEADAILAKFGWAEEAAVAAQRTPVLLWMLVKELGRRQRAKKTRKGEESSLNKVPPTSCVVVSDEARKLTLTKLVVYLSRWF